ncbi:MAG: transporter substrate-binding domain-containing protein [Alphaproteobacteria bacterium]|nr:transporter substrate-binding domain-containing protein [Alphaproteobacteria bacterium]
MGSDKPGVFIEIAQRAFEPLGISIDYKIVPWTRAVEETREGNFTAITGASRADAPDFIYPDIPQGKSIMTFFAPVESSWTYNGIDSLKGISLGVIESYAYGDSIDKYIADNTDNMERIQALSGDEALTNNIQKLIKKRVHAVIESRDVFNYAASQLGVTRKIRQAGMLPLTEDQNLFIAFSPKNPESKRYAKILTDAMNTLKENGELNAILAKYNLATQEIPTQ